MNERIKKLAFECATSFDYGSVSPNPTEFCYTEQALEKFAELIVKECIDVALEQKKWVEDMQTLNSFDETWNLARIQQSQHIVDKIKEHFGVEE